MSHHHDLTSFFSKNENGDALMMMPINCELYGNCNICQKKYD